LKLEGKKGDVWVTRAACQKWMVLASRKAAGVVATERFIKDALSCGRAKLAWGGAEG